ncbi:MAG: tetraacyldisaccharide 4'-kinase [Rhodospirillales bacterium]|nr:tetraacyldisaccharide 4'-kinase [Rhodospirillales bacterium]
MQAPDFWHRAGPVGWALAPLGWIYAGAEAAHMALARSWKAPVPVICIGNLVAGGAGKTPVALAIGERLTEAEVPFHFLSRGYGGSATGPLRVDPARHDAAMTGDEPLLLARAAPAWVSRKRVPGAQAAIAGGARAVVMDDGFQNPWLHKDISIVVVDGGYGFGNGQVMPAGPLRETVRCGLARAQAVVVVGEDRRNVRHGIERITKGRIPILSAHIEPDIQSAEVISGKTVVAFAGIARPEKFFHTLESLGCTLVERRPFPDHHPYDERETRAILSIADSAGAIPVTTEKDAVRLPPELRSRVRTLKIRLRWDDEGALEKILEPVLSHGR